MAAGVGGITVQNPAGPNSNAVNPDDPSQLATAPGATDPTNLGAGKAVDNGTNAGLALKALSDASGLNLLGSYNSASGTVGGYTPAGSQGGVAPMQTPDQSAANAAAYNTAKDSAATTGNAALQGLEGSLASRGLLGSGLEARGMEQLAESAQGQIGQVSRDQAINNAALAQQTAETNYQGGLTQRGQDITQETAYRGQDTQLLAAQQARQAQLVQGLLGALGGGGGQGILY